MESRNLQDFTSLPILNIKEALDYLGWEYKQNDNRFHDIRCCGEPVECNGFFGGTEDLTCNICNKHMHDMFGVTPVSRSTATMLDPKDFDIVENRHWTVVIPGVISKKD